MHTVWHQLLRSTTTGTEFRETRIRLWSTFRELTGLERRTYALEDVELTDFSHLACGLLSHLDQLMLPPVNQEIVSQSVEAVHGYISRTQTSESNPRIQNNFTIYLLTRTSHQLPAYLTRCIQFLHETALLFEPCVHHAIVMIKVLWAFIQDVMITSYGLDARLLLAQTSCLVEAFLRLSVRPDLSSDLTPIQVIDVFGPSARWRKVLCSDHQLLNIIIGQIDAVIDLGPRNSTTSPGRRSSAQKSASNSLSPNVAPTQNSVAGTSNSAMSASRVIRLQSATTTSQSHQCFQPRRLPGESPPGGRKLKSAESSRDDMSLASPYASPIVTEATVKSGTPRPPQMGQVNRDACMLQVLFLLVGCCEELNLKSSLGTDVSRRVLRLCHRLFVQASHSVVEQYNEIWVRANCTIDPTTTTDIKDCASMLGGLGLVLLFNMGCTKSGSRFLHDNGVTVLEIMNEIHARFRLNDALRPLIGGLMECIVAGTPTDIHMLAQLNPKRIKHYNQIMKCGRCGRMAVGSRKLKICGECHLTRYCGRACQQEDWKEYHSKTCKSQHNETCQ